MRFRLTTPVLWILVSLALTTTSMAQVVRGSISGTVSDPQGAVVASADVKASQAQTGAVFTTTSDKSGLFRLQQLPIGTYRVELSRTGFRKLVQNDITVSAGADTGLGVVKLQLGEVTEQVEVVAGTPLVDTSEAQVTNSYTGQQLSTFAGVAENQGLDQLALYIPGVVSSRDLGFSNTNGGLGFSVNGLRGRNNDQQIDGQNNNDNSVGGPALFLSDPEFVSEYQVTTNNFGAQYGRNSGSVVNIITKSGSNDWHGSVFGTESNSALNTRNNIQKRFDDLKKVPQFNDEFSGGTIGGPLVKNRFFVFGGFDNELVSSSSVFSTGNLTPTPTGLSQLAACFPGNANLAILHQFGPFGITGGNPTPQGVTTRAVNGCGNVEMSGVQRTLANDNRTWDWIARSDLVFDKDHFTARYIYNKNTSIDTDAFATAAAGYPASVPSLSQDLTLTWNHTISNRMVNEFRINLGRINVEFGGNTIGNTVPNQGDIGTALARLSFSDPKLLGFGPATTAPQGRIVNQYQLQDNWNYVVGRHQLKAGVNYTYQRSPNIFLPNFNGAFTFADWSAYFANTPASVSITLGNPSLDFREHDSFVYFGDDFKLTPNLTLNLGLTYSYYGQPANLFHNTDVKRESTASTAFFNPALPLSLRVFPSIPAPKTSFGPSIGFAYSPQWGGFLTGEGKTVLRGGYRLAYDPPVYNIYTNISSSAPQVLAQTLSGASAPPLPSDPIGTNVRTTLGPLLTLGTADPRRFNQTTVTPDFGPDRVHSWSFGVQRELTNALAAEVRYVGNHAQNLFQSIDANPRISTLATDFPTLVPSGLTPCPAANAVVPSATGRVDCNRGIVRERTNTAYSDYNALQVEVRATRLLNQLTLRSAYTFSRTTDNASEIFGSFAGGGTTAFSQNPLDFKGGEHALSGLDTPHTWTLGFQEELPFMRQQQGISGHVLGGWVVSAAYILSSGQPYTPTQFALNGALFGGGPDYTDQPFMNAFNSQVENLRPFLGNPSAPVTAVGMFAGDMCSNVVPTACPAAILANPNQLLSLTAFNASGAFTPVTTQNVRYIVNSTIAQGIFGSPFGNVRRNSARDAKANYGNFSLYKTFKVTERTNLQWHMTMQNVFNHPNYSSIDPFLDDAGLQQNGTGFGDPTLFTDSTLGTTRHGRRQIVFGLRFGF